MQTMPGNMSNAQLNADVPLGYVKLATAIMCSVPQLLYEVSHNIPGWRGAWGRRARRPASAKLLLIYFKPQQPMCITQVEIQYIVQTTVACS